MEGFYSLYEQNFDKWVIFERRIRKNTKCVYNFMQEAI